MFDLRLIMNAGWLAISTGEIFSQDSVLIYSLKYILVIEWKCGESIGDRNGEK